MRLIGEINNEQDAQKLSLFLQKKGILSNVDGSFDAKTGLMSYHMWALNEDQIQEAQTEFSKFIQNPKSPLYDLPFVMETPQEPPRRGKTPFTIFIIALCTFIFLLNLLQEGPDVPMTQVQSTLLFDLPQEGIPVWTGIYDLIGSKFKGEVLPEGPLFQNILQGEIWRLFSPAILHLGLLHILFNMIWVWMLSRPIEQRIGVWKIALLSCLIGVGSNVAQYLMGGPFFLGYSGVVMGLAGFTWERERRAPWEGYPLHHSTVLFLVLFVGGMFLIQATSFVLQLFTHIAFSPRIANTAHIAGAIIGVFLGKCSFFKRKDRI